MKVRLNRKQKSKKILKAKDVFEIMREILRREDKANRNKEHLWVISLSITNKILLIDLVSLGNMNNTNTTPTDIFSSAIEKRASSIILIHNHPSGGSLEPSDDDLKFTLRMIRIGEIVQLPLSDHIIITEEGFYSFTKAGVLEALKKSDIYNLSFVVEANKFINQGRKEKAREIAKACLKEDMSQIKISKLTGLSIKDIKGL